MIILLLQPVFAGYIIETLWNNLDCNTAPYAVAIINDTTTTTITEIADTSSPVPYCGMAYSDVYSGCCYQVFNYIQPPYYSFERHYIQTIDFTEFAKSANGYEYCQLKSVDGGLMFGYEEYDYLDNNQCLDSYFKCNGNIFSIYSDLGCTGTVQEMHLNSNDIYQSPLYGNMTFGKIKATNGTIAIVWMTSDQLEAPPEHYTGFLSIEIFGLICGSISFLGFVVTCVYYVIKFLRAPNLINMWLWLTQLMWILRCITTVLYVYYLPPTELLNEIQASIWCFSCICTYMSSMVSSNIIIRLFNWQHQWKAYALYCTISTASLLLAGPTYLYFLYYKTQDIEWLQYLYYYAVNNMYTAFETFMLVYDVLPPIIFLYRMSKINLKKLKDDQLTQFIKWKRILWFIMALEGTNMSTYVYMFWLQYYSLQLGGDAQFEMIWVIQLMNFWIHNGVLVLIFECLKEMMKLTLRQSKDRQQQPDKQVQTAHVASSNMKDTVVDLVSTKKSN
ncbi:hypothetical protein HDV01_000598 [Terramyces sp. JEL0728]|nr:hypothetical protein HDV01_000598 [Terramyces sp. JEL0728]